MFIFAILSQITFFFNPFRHNIPSFWFFLRFFYAVRKAVDFFAPRRLSEKHCRANSPFVFAKKSRRAVLPVAKNVLRRLIVFSAFRQYLTLYKMSS